MSGRGATSRHGRARADHTQYQLQPVLGRRVAGLVEAGNCLLPEPGGLVVGEALLGLYSGQPAVPGRVDRVGARLGEVVGQGGHLAGAVPFDRFCGPGVQPGAAQPGQAVVEGVADQGVANRIRPGSGSVTRPVSSPASMASSMTCSSVPATSPRTATSISCRGLPQDGLGGGREHGRSASASRSPPGRATRALLGSSAYSRVSRWLQ